MNIGRESTGFSSMRPGGGSPKADCRLRVVCAPAEYQVLPHRESEREPGENPVWWEMALAQDPSRRRQRHRNAPTVVSPQCEGCRQRGDFPGDAGRLVEPVNRRRLEKQRLECAVRTGSVRRWESFAIPSRSCDGPSARFSRRGLRHGALIWNALNVQTASHGSGQNTPAIWRRSEPARRAPSSSFAARTTCQWPSPGVCPAGSPALHGTSTASGRLPKKKPWPAFTAASITGSISRPVSRSACRSRSSCSPTSCGRALDES
jgi:hypothetical protein